MTRTLYDKLVDNHKVCDLPDGDMLIYVDFHIMNEYTLSLIHISEPTRPY